MTEKISPPQPTETQKNLHYRLTSEEWLEINKRLKPSEIKVLYYLRTLDPFGDRDIELGIREIARDLDCNPSSVSRALRKLAEENLIDLELIKVRVRVHSKPPPPDPECCPQATVLPPGNSRCTQATADAHRQQPMHTGNNHAPEPNQDAGFRPPHTIHTDQTFKNSLSPDERELIDFVQRRLKNTEGIRDLRAYAIAVIAKDRDHWKTELKREQQKVDVPPPSPRPVEKVLPEETPAQRLERYRVQWLIPACRPGIRQAIAAHPQWNITLDQLKEQLPDEQHDQHDQRDPRSAISGSPGTDRDLPPSRSRSASDCSPNALHQGSSAET